MRKLLFAVSLVAGCGGDAEEKSDPFAAVQCQSGVDGARYALVSVPECMALAISLPACCARMALGSFEGEQLTNRCLDGWVTALSSGACSGSGGRFRDEDRSMPPTPVTRFDTAQDCLNMGQEAGCG